MTTQSARPRSEVVKAGVPTSQLTESAITNTSAASASCSCGEQPLQARRADLLLALDEDGDAHRRMPVERPQRRQVHREAALVVRRPAPVQALAPLGGDERCRQPGRRVALGLDVVVRVEADGRGPGRGGVAADHRRHPVGGDDPYVGAAGARQEGGDGFGRRLHLVRDGRGRRSPTRRRRARRGRSRTCGCWAWTVSARLTAAAYGGPPTSPETEPRTEDDGHEEDDHHRDHERHDRGPQGEALVRRVEPAVEEA